MSFHTPVVLVVLAGCSTSNPLRPAPETVRPTVQMRTPAGVDAPLSGMPSSIGLDGALLHRYDPYVDVDVDDAGCVTATTLYSTWWSPVTFTDQGATFSEQHGFLFTTTGQDGVSFTDEPNVLVGGTLQVLERSASAWEFQIVDAVRACRYGITTDCADDPGTFWARVEGDIVSPAAPWEIRSTSDVLTPEGDAPLCAGVHPELSSWFADTP